MWPLPWHFFLSLTGPAVQRIGASVASVAGEWYLLLWLASQPEKSGKHGWQQAPWGAESGSGEQGECSSG